MKDKYIWYDEIYNGVCIYRKGIYNGDTPPFLQNMNKYITSNDIYRMEQMIEYINNTETIVLSSNEYNSLPQYMKIKYVWIEEKHYDDMMNEFVSYRKETEYIKCLHYIVDNTDHIVITAEEYNMLSQDMKNKYIWIKDNSDPFNICYGKDDIELDSMIL